MDSRAKQRITGAVILVAAFVLLVPELLTGPGDKASAENEPATASDEAGLRRYTIDIDAPTGTAPADQSPQTAVELPTPAAATPMAVPGEAAVPEPAPRESDPAPSDAAPMAAAPAATPSTTAQPPPTAPSTPAPRVEPRPESTPPPTSVGGFAVQLGSFSSRDNANRLVRDMTAKGFAAFVAPIKSNGRELYRVRVGPARDRAAAEALAAQLRRIGQTGSIVSIS